MVILEHGAPQPLFQRKPPRRLKKARNFPHGLWGEPPARLIVGSLWKRQAAPPKSRCRSPSSTRHATTRSAITRSPFRSRGRWRCSRSCPERHNRNSRADAPLPRSFRWEAVASIVHGLNERERRVAEKGGSRTLRGPYGPQTGFEDQRHHRAPSFSTLKVKSLACRLSSVKGAMC